MTKRITKTTTFRKTTRTVRRPKAKATFAKKVNAVLAKKIEVKSVSHDSGLVAFNSSIAVAGDIQRIVPYMAQGLDTGGRVGNEITAKRLTVKGHMIMNLANAGYSGSVRIGVRMMCLTSKRYKHIDDLTTNPSLHLNFLLKSGNAIQPFNGNISDLYLQINREVYTVHYDKVKYITIPLIYTATGTHDLHQSVKMFSFSVPCKNKKITYEDSLSNAPQNYAPFWVLGYSKLDGSSPDSVLTQISCETISTLYYTDM